MRHPRKLPLGGVVVMLFAVLVWGGTASADADDENVLVRGQVHWAQGGTADGISVIAMVRLPASARSELAEGDEVVAPVVGEYLTGRNGHFEFAVDGGSIPSTYVDESGATPFTIALFEGEQLLHVYNLDLHPPSNGKGPWRADILEDDRGAKNSRSMALKFVIDPEDPDQSSVEESTGLADSGSTAGVVEPPNGERVENAVLACVESKGTTPFDYRTRLELLGTNSSYVSYDYEFERQDSQTNSHQIGIGYSSSGVDGSFTRSGKTTVFTNLTLRWPTYSKASAGRNHRRAYVTKTRYYGWLVQCTSGTRIYFELRPDWVKGDVLSEVWSARYYRSASKCVAIEAGGEAERKYGSTMWHTTAVDIGAKGSKLEVKNELKSGADHRVTFKNTANSTRKYVCGQHAPIGSPNRTGTLVGDYRNS